MRTILDLFTNCLFFIGGLSLLGFRDTFAKRTIEVLNRACGFRFGAKEERFTKIMALIAGTAFVVSSVLSFFGVIRYR